MSSQQKTEPKMSLKDALAQAITEALSEMAFLDAMPPESPSAQFATSHIITVGFSRPVVGKIALYLSLDCKKAVAENVHGRDWDSLKAAEIDDCLLEMGNVVAGNFLSAYCGKGTAHDVGLPIALFDDAEIEFPGERADVEFDVEGHQLRATAGLD